MNPRSRVKLLKLLVMITALLVGGCKPLVSVAVATTSPGDQSVTFSKGSDVVVGAGGSLEGAITEDFASYEWILDGVVLVGETSRAVTVDSSPLAPGVHHLAAIVGSNGRLYSRILRFFVAN
jgi:hypothetical protein